MFFIYFGLAAGLVLMGYLLMIKCNNCWRPAQKDNIWYCADCEKLMQDNEDN